MTKAIDYELVKQRLMDIGYDPNALANWPNIADMRDWCRDGADAIHALTAEVERLRALDAPGSTSN